LAKKLNDGKQPFLWSYHFTVMFWPVLLGLYTVAILEWKKCGGVTAGQGKSRG